MQMIERVLVFIFGSIVGSFLNVCIYRLPLGKSIVTPGSFCPQCGHSILSHDNIPFFSYIFLKGKCRFCKKRIPLRYFIVELITALMFLILYNRYGLGFDLFFYIVFVCGLIIATFVDIQHRIIPDEISLGGMAVGFLLAVIEGFKPKPMTYNVMIPLESLLGILIGGGVIYLTGVLFDLVYFKLLKRPPIQGETESMGGGDVKLLAMIGAFLGWQKALLTFFLAPFFGAIIGIVNLMVKKDHTIPYGPFLALAAIISLFWFNRIISLFLIK
jgi:leader peptidase (prepilin peptidase)/N-methyltransferase